jgi:hypothetical protein
MLKILTLVTAVILVCASFSPTFAAPKNTPGHLMQRHGSVPGHPGASGYAPGHLKKKWHARSARHFAPGHRHHARKHHHWRYVHHRKHHRHHAHHRKHHRVIVTR